MLRSLRWLALEAKYLEAARSFYGDVLALPVVNAGTIGPDGADATASEGADVAASDADGPTEVVYEAGDHHLRVRRPSGVPRGGLHTHFAFATPDDRYDEWWDRLSDTLDLQEHRFGDARSLYCYDPDGNCVEIGQSGGGSEPITGIFEVVLEVEALDRAESFYRDLGFEPVDRGDGRRRVRLDGPVALELWEPQLGIADARGGVHVDLGYWGDPDAVVDAVGERALEVRDLEDGVRIRDPDGHWLTVR